MKKKYKVDPKSTQASRKKTARRNKRNLYTIYIISLTKIFKRTILGIGINL